MPIITYTPDEGEPETYEFAFGDMSFDEVVELEQLTGRNWGELERLYWNDNFMVQGYLLLVLMRRQSPHLSMPELGLVPRQLSFDMSPSEIETWVARMLGKPELSDEEKESLRELGVDPDAPGPDVVVVGEVAEAPKA